MNTTAPTQAYEDLASWDGQWPFLGQEPYPRVIHEQDAYFQAWGISNEGMNRTPVWFYASTKHIDTGIFSLAPGDYFKPGNHPNPEPYLILDGTIHLGNPDTGQLLEATAGDVVIIPAFQMHVGHNFGSETCRMLWMIPRQKMTDEFHENPVYDDHYMNFRSPIVLHKETVHHHEAHEGFAQPNFRVGSSPKSRHADLREWPPSDAASPARERRGATLPRTSAAIEIDSQQELRGFGEHRGDRREQRVIGIRRRHVAHRLRERFAVEHGENRALGAQPALAQIREQRGARGGVLGRALAHPEHVLLAVGINPERDEQYVANSGRLPKC